jgi:hypothetical protein
MSHLDQLKVWKPEISEFEGKPVLSIPMRDFFAFKFGLMKAKAILENLEAIKKFVETDGKECENNSDEELRKEYESDNTPMSLPGNI